MGSHVSEMTLFEFVVDVQIAMSCLSSPQTDAHPVLVKKLHTLPHSLATYLSRLPALCCRPAWDRSVTDRLQNSCSDTSCGMPCNPFMLCLFSGAQPCAEATSPATKWHDIMDYCSFKGALWSCHWCAVVVGVSASAYHEIPMQA